MKKQSIYVDMDGVVADFEGGAATFLGYRIDPGKYYPDNDWKKIRNHKRIFRDLPKMKRADEMVNLARRFRDELGYELLFLTAMPHNNDMHWAFWDKILWVKNYYPDIPVHFGPRSSDKKEHCEPGDILIDDRSDNCDQWQAAKGIAIRVKRNSYTSALKELEELLEKKLGLKRLSQY
jgi:5'(3')-deoxyribonucleotidase